MKIAFIIPSLANKGPVLVVKELVDQFVRKDIDCTIYYFDPIEEVKMQCPVKQIKITDKIAFTQYDIIHCHLLRPDGWGFRWSFKKEVRKKLITTIHNYFIDDLTFAYSKPKAILGSYIWRLFWSRFNKIVVLTESARIYYSRYLSSRKLSVVYNGRNITPSEIEEQDIPIFQQFKEKSYTILGTIASFNARKGLEQIIKFLPEAPEYAFVIVGDGPEKENLFNLAQKLGVADRVCFLGSRMAGHRYNRYFDVFAIPSRAEGVPLALLEAAAQKVPVLCSDIDVFKEVFSANEAFFFELDNIASIKEALDKWKLHGETYRQKAFEKYQRTFTAEVMAENYLVIYKEISASK